jgi:ribosomal protein S18 acetylase RimI-like enzyme
MIGYSLAEVHVPNPGFRREKYGYIDDAAVTASHRRKGIGQMMLVEITKCFQSKNIHRVELGIVARNQVAYSFWHKQGFEVYMQTLYKEI